MGRLAEAAEEARRALAMARELGYPAGEAMALANLAFAAALTRRPGRARCSWPGRPQQITADIPGSIARGCSYVLDRSR